jgi:hypothetical protein
MQSTDHAQPASRPQRFVKICNGGAATFAADDGSRPDQGGHRRGRPASFRRALNYKLGTVRKLGLLGASPPLGFEDADARSRSFSKAGAFF